MVDFHSASLVIIHILFKKKMQSKLKLIIDRRKPCIIDGGRDTFLLLTPFSSCGKIFEQILKR